MKKSTYMMEYKNLLADKLMNLGNLLFLTSLFVIVIKRPENSIFVVLCGVGSFILLYLASIYLVSKD